MKFLPVSLITFLIVPLAMRAADSPGTVAIPVAQSKALPFDREVINRYSLDHLPRSLSIRQGADVWLGYDLERAKLYKLWQAPAGKPGLTTAGFVTRSAGTSWFEDKSAETWQLQRAGKAVPLTARYLGCSQRAAHFELSWELQHDTGVVILRERIPMAVTEAERVVREIRAESLGAGEALLLPIPARGSWKFAGANGATSSTLTDTDWHRLILP